MLTAQFSCVNTKSEVIITQEKFHFAFVVYWIWIILYGKMSFYDIKK